MIVACADITLNLRKKMSKNEVLSIFKNFEKNQKHKIIKNFNDPLVSLDFKVLFIPVILIIDGQMLI